MKYEISNGSTLLATVDNAKTYSVSGLMPLTSYTLSVIANNGLRKSSAATVTFKTRGIQFVIPTALTVGATGNLRYQEYSLGMVPIGTEPTGMFGGGNKKMLPFKVISSANGSSVVEVAGNVIEVGGRNLISGSYDSSWSFASNMGATIQKITMDSGEVALHVIGTSNSSGFYAWFTLPSGDNTTSIEVKGTGTVNVLGWEGLNYTHMTPTSNWQRVSITNSFDGKPHPFVFYGAMDVYVRLLKAEKGNTTTPYASFVDGDTFTAQPDGTYALFSEYKALYY